jgi:uncharacterized protein YkwD
MIPDYGSSLTWGKLLLGHPPANFAVAQRFHNTGTGSGGGTAACAFTTDPAKVTEAINAINTYRTTNGLPKYNVKEPLTKAAQSHAADMACKNLTGHTGSDGSTPGTRISKNGYVAAFSAENVYFSNPPLSGQGAVDWWKNDTGDIRHNLNMISDTFIDVGVGYAFFNNNGYYVVVFATHKIKPSRIC